MSSILYYVKNKIAIGLVLCLGLSLAACGAQSGQEAAEPVTTGEATVLAQEPAEAPETAEPEIAEPEIAEPEPIAVEYTDLAVDPIDQYAEGCPSGCEAACLLMGLQYKGHATEYVLADFILEMPYAPEDDPDPNVGYAGQPYTLEDGTYQSIFPQAMIPWAEQYGGVCEDVSGQDAWALVEQVLQDNTVLFFTTYKYAEAEYEIYHFGGADHNMVNNAHVVLLCGYDPEKNQVKIADPSFWPAGFEPTYWIDYKDFERTYNYAKMALAIVG